MSGIEIALEMEKRGFSLYKRAQLIVSDPDMLNLLYKLENEEREHYDYFNSLKQQEPFDETDGDDGWNAHVASALAAEALYPGGLIQAAYEGALDSTAKLLDTAINSEIASIEFYGKLKEKVSENERGLIEHIISQEHNHLSELMVWKSKYEY